MRSLANIVRKKTKKQKTNSPGSLQKFLTELRKKRFEPEGSEKYMEVNINIKKCMINEKENWIGEQLSETEENLRQNNCKRAYQLVKDSVTVKQGKVTTTQDRSGNWLSEERDILNRWTEYCSELYNRSTTPAFAKKVEAVVLSLS